MENLTKQGNAQGAKPTTTQGEWKVSPNSRIIVCAGKRIAECDYADNLTHIPKDKFLSMGESQANAQLISASPDMYEALKKSYEELLSAFAKECKTNNLNQAESKIEKGSLLDTMRQALIKAEGK